MARTQVTGIEIGDSTVAPIDLTDEVVPYIRQRSRPMDRIIQGETITILENTQHITVAELVIEGSVINNGTIGIL